MAYIIKKFGPTLTGQSLETLPDSDVLQFILQNAEPTWCDPSDWNQYVWRLQIGNQSIEISAEKVGDKFEAYHVNFATMEEI
jgi:hypothetical protein